MDALARIRAFDALQNAGRSVVSERGLPTEIAEGEAISRYRWVDGELAEILEPDGTRLEYGYGEDGRLLSVDRNGVRWASYQYDSHDRLVAVSRPDGPLEHGYDSQGRLVHTLRGNASALVYRWEGNRVASARCDRETTQFGHDDQGRLTGLDQSVAGQNLGVRFVFDSQSRLESVTFPDWNCRIGYVWDDQGRPLRVDWNGQTVCHQGSEDDQRLAWSQALDGTREQSWHERRDGSVLRKSLSSGDGLIWSQTMERDEGFRIVGEGDRRHEYDPLGRLAVSRDPDREWKYGYDALDNPLGLALELDQAGRICRVAHGGRERTYRYNDAGELLEMRVDGIRVARCSYDYKSRLLLKTGSAGTERYLYGADDSLLAVADEDCRPLLVYLRLPTGLVGVVDFRTHSGGEIVCLHSDSRGNLVYAGYGDGRLEGPFASDPFGLPLGPVGTVGAIHRGRIWHAEMGLYRVGCRWYDPVLHQFLTPDTFTGAPDDARLVHAFRPAIDQRMARAGVLVDWLRQPRLRNRRAWCLNDPINRIDPDGHWSFGGVLLSILGVLWTLPNTIFGLALEVTCLIGEVIRWMVCLCSGGKLTWQMPGFTVATSGRLNAFALVFKGGWLGSFENLLGITFGNVMFVKGNFLNDPSIQDLPDPVHPSAYNGAVSIPRSQALFEHELRHVNQYGWWGPFFNLGLPLFGIYEWQVILHGYRDAPLEVDARAHGGF